METKKTVPIWLTVILLIFCAVAIGANLVGLVANDLGIAEFLCYILCLTATMMAACYCLSGYKKNVASFFQYVSVTTLLAIAASIYYAVTVARILPTVLLAIALVSMAVVAFGKNLGKVLSAVLALTTMAVIVALTVYALVCYGVMVTYLTLVLLSVIFVMMVYAKYRDKAARGSK